MSEELKPIGMPISFNIPLDIPNIDIIFWMRPFTTSTLLKRYKIDYPFSTLYIQKSISYNERKAMDPILASSLSFSITPNILNGVKEIFKEAKSWFTEENLSVLYGMNDEGILMFNSEYKKLNALYVNEYGSSKTALKIVPTVIEVGNNVMKPGVIFYINLTANGIALRDFEFIRLADFILDFNFITYNQFAMQCFDHCLLTGSILSREQIQERLNYQRQYNTNFRY